MTRNEENFRNYFLEVYFDIFNNNEFLFENLNKEFEKGNFDLLWIGNYEKEKEIFDGYENFIIDNMKNEAHSITNVDK